MAYLNVSAPADFVSLIISSDSTNVGTTGTWTVSTASQITVPALQDITVTNNNGTFAWKQLDSQSRKVVATPATNSLNFNIVLDDKAFFGDSAATTSTAKADGLVADLQST
jgi:hypothetical protein